jgi:hypothetical protein
MGGRAILILEGYAHEGIDVARVAERRPQRHPAARVLGHEPAAVSEQKTPDARSQKFLRTII